MKNPATDSMFSNAPVPLPEDPDRLTRSHAVTRRRFIQYGVATSTSLMAMAAAGSEKEGGEERLLNDSSWRLVETSPNSSFEDVSNTGSYWQFSTSGVLYQNRYVADVHFFYAPVVLAAPNQPIPQLEKTVGITTKVGVTLWGRSYNGSTWSSWQVIDGIFNQKTGGFVQAYCEMNPADGSEESATAAMSRADDVDYEDDSYTQGWRIEYRYNLVPGTLTSPFDEYWRFQMIVTTKKEADGDIPSQSISVAGNYMSRVDIVQI